MSTKKLTIVCLHVLSFQKSSQGAKYLISGYLTQKLNKNGPEIWPKSTYKSQTRARIAVPAGTYILPQAEDAGINWKMKGKDCQIKSGASGCRSCNTLCRVRLHIHNFGISFESLCWGQGGSRTCCNRSNPPDFRGDSSNREGSRATACHISCRN